MRSSRISRDAAKLFECAPEPVSPPRRTTRSSLARFALATATTKDIKSEIRDIEDVANLPIRKRRRTATTSEPVSPNEMKTKHVKTEQIKAEPVKLKRIKSEDIEDVLSSIPSPPPKAPRRARKPARKAVDPSTGDTTIEPPSDWEVMYNTVRRMRAPGGAAYGAAVDTMGCERLADSQSSPKDQRYHTLVSLQLSSQTKDVVTSVVIKRLQTELPAYKSGAPVGLNVNNMLSVEPGLLNQMIWTVGFHNNKTKYLKQTAEILRDEWNGDIPDTIEGLMSLPGVGPKMAYLCMSVAWNRTEGIGVDVHVHRITNLWGWNKTKNPEETRLALQSWLPHDRWREINSLLVGLGQAVCLPVGRKCGECELGFEGLCKAADRKKVAEGRKMKAEKVEAESDDTAVKVEAKLEVVEPVDVKAEEDVKLEKDAQGVVVKHEA